VPCLRCLDGFVLTLLLLLQCNPLPLGCRQLLLLLLLL
jgi:hypothetical protein